MNLDTFSTIASIISPLSEALVDHWLVPKVKALKAKHERYSKLKEENIKKSFENYIKNKYESLVYINLLVLRNQKRLFSDIYIPLTIEYSTIKQDKRSGSIVEQLKSVKIDKYPSDLLKNSNHLLISDSAGMGKSTLLKKIFIECVNNNISILIFVDLRRLSKNNTILDELEIEISLINKEADSSLLRDLLSTGNFCIILDGYDEIRKDELTFVTRDIQKLIEKSPSNTYILSSRPDAALTAFSSFKEVNIRPLKKDEAYELLSKYDNGGEVSKTLIDKIKADKSDIAQFLTNPLLTTLLFSSFDYKRKIPLNKPNFYRQIFDALFEAHDLSKGDYYIREKQSKLSIDEFHTILRYLAFQLVKKGKNEVVKDELIEIIANCKEKSHITNFSESHFINDVLKSVPVFVKDGLYFRFSHKSLSDYFAAQFIAYDADSYRDKLLESLFKDWKSGYFNILDIFSDIDYKSFRRVIMYELFTMLCKRFDESIYPNEKLENTNKIRQSIILSSYYAMTSQSFNGGDHAQYALHHIQKNVGAKYSITPVGGLPNALSTSIRVDLTDKHKRMILLVEITTNENKFINSILKIFDKKQEDIFITCSTESYPLLNKHFDKGDILLIVKDKVLPSKGEQIIEDEINRLIIRSTKRRILDPTRVETELTKIINMSNRSDENFYKL